MLKCQYENEKMKLCSANLFVKKCVEMLMTHLNYKPREGPIKRSPAGVVLRRGNK